GAVLSVGLVMAVAAIALLSASAGSRREPIDAFEEAEAEQLESSVQRLVEAGAPEGDVRDLVREAMRLRRRAWAGARTSGPTLNSRPDSRPRRARCSSSCVASCSAAGHRRGR